VTDVIERRIHPAVCARALPWSSEARRVRPPHRVAAARHEREQRAAIWILVVTSARTGGLLALVCALLVGWLWHLPLTLSGADALADRAIRRQVQTQLGREGLADLDARTERWLRDNAARVEEVRQPQAERFRAAMSFTAADGRRHAFLGDLDSYAWVREARNVLEHGTTCDEIRDGECRDTYVNPPHGTPMPYRRSVHIAAIVGVHWILSRLDPGIPLTTSAAWVAVLGGVMTSLLAFAVGYRVAGLVGGIVAALLIPLDPFVLERSLGSDNDVWTLALPLLLALLASTALEGDGWRRRVPLVVAMMVAAALYAMTWSGWIFHGAVVLGGAAAFVASAWIGHAGDRRQRCALLATFAVLVLGIVVAVAPLDGFRGAGTRLVGLLEAWSGRSAGHAATADTVAGVWPPMLATVTELERTTFARVVTGFVGRVACAIGCAGFLLLLLPRRAAWWALAGALSYGVLLTASVDLAALGSRFYVGATLVPALVLLGWRARRASDDRPRCLEIIVVVWFVAAVGASHWGARYALLLAIPFGLAAAVALARAAELVAAAVLRWWPRPAVAHALAATVVIGILAPFLARSHAAAAAYTPVLNTAWWNVLQHARTHSAKDAIVTSWWDYGYWVKYLAGRRTTVDGASLSSHRPYWVARMLVSRDPREAIGLLRMLNCAGDDSPFADGEQSAYGLIQRRMQDAVQSQALLLEIVRQPRGSAATTLAARGFTEAQQAEILAATHCEPPESLLVVNRALAGPNVWMQVGTWDFRKAEIARALRHSPPDAVIEMVQQRFGITADAAAELVRRAQSESSFTFISGRASRIPPSWYACRPGPTASSLSCPVGLEEPTSGRVIEEVVVPLSRPSATRMKVSFANQPEWQTLVPAELWFAGQTLIQIPVEPEPDEDVAVLVDVERRRVMLGSPAFLSSIYFRLVFLDGRYAPGFEKLIEEQALDGDRISLWRVRFPGSPPSR